MFNLKIFIPTIIFLFLLIITSFVKNQTRIIEKNLYKLNKKIALKTKDINMAKVTNKIDALKLIKKRDDINIKAISVSFIIIIRR